MTEAAGEENGGNGQDKDSYSDSTSSEEGQQRKRKAEAISDASVEGTTTEGATTEQATEGTTATATIAATTTPTTAGTIAKRLGIASSDDIAIPAEVSIAGGADAIATLAAGSSSTSAGTHPASAAGTSSNYVIAHALVAAAASVDASTSSSSSDSVIAIDDASLSPPQELKSKRKRKAIPRKATFAQKLMVALADPTCRGAMSWVPDGHSFVIMDPDLFCQVVMPRYFGTKSNKFESFTRKLNRWGECIRIAWAD